MPGMDKNGPFGNGPVGRGMGPCGNGHIMRDGGRGFSRRGGGIWGMMSSTASPDEENEILEQQKNWLETQLEAINEKLQELGKTKVSK